jgi:uncharacterized protein (DUF2236 family)
MHDILFADLDGALASAANVWRRHGRVRGVADGHAYHARDPDLALWVLATTADSWVQAYEAVVAPLTPDERERYYAEMCGTAGLFGIPERCLPPTWSALSGYVAAAADVQVGPTARRIRDRLFACPPSTALVGLFGVPAAVAAPVDFGPVARRVMAAFTLITAGFLPAHLRRDLGFAWSRAHALRFAATLAALRRVVPRLPAALRFAPPYLAARRRVAAAS